MSFVTKIIVHRSENRKKCSVEPLRARNDFEFYTFPLVTEINLENYIRLGIGGKALSSEDTDKGLLVLDSTWRHAEAMEKPFTDMPVRSLEGWKTAYPRVSKIFDDPQEGLATIEAIYAALFITGRNTEGLLDDYFWKDQFLSLNKRCLKIT